MKIAQGIYQLKVPIPDNPLGHLNCYLVQGKQGWLMVDTGWFTADALNSLQTQIKELGLALTDVSTIIITHVHPDHFGLAGRIKQISPKTQILTHQWESALIESRYIKFSDLIEKMSAHLAQHGVPSLSLSALESASIPSLEFVNVTFPERVLYGGEIISTGIYDLEIIWTPGHSPGHICLYEPQNQLLFSGDHILPGITPNISYHVQSGDNPLGDYIYALSKLQHLAVSRVLPAHEEAFDNLQGRIKEIIIHHEKRKAEILEVMAGKPRNAWEISSQISWDTPEPWDKLPPLHQRSGVSEVIAHLEYLRKEGKVNKTIKADTISYEC